MLRMNSIPKRLCRVIVDDLQAVQKQQKIVRLSTRSLSSQSGRRKTPHFSVLNSVSVVNKNQLINRFSLRSYASGNGYPQHSKVVLPALSPTMERGSLKSWEKKEGDKLSEGDLLALIETDKATMDFETPEEGYLAKIVVPGGTKDVPLGSIICIIVPNQADVAAFKDFSAGAGAATPAQSAKTEAPASPKSDSIPEERRSAVDLTKFPEHQQIVLPALSPTVEKSTIKAWGKKEGDKIAEGDMIAQVETDKATIDWNWENPDEMYVAKILIPEGTTDVPVGKLVAIFVSKKDDVAAFKDFTAEAAGSGAVPTPIEKPKEAAAAAYAPSPSTPSPLAAAQAPARQPGERVFASPLARTLAKEKGIDLAAVKGTGPDGRIVAEDVLKYQPSAQPAQAQQQPSTAAAEARPPAPTAPATGEYEDLPLTNIRQVIAKRLLQSKQTIPHYYLSVEISLDEVLKLRQEFNSMLEKEKVKISVNDFVIKASALACKKVPQANSSWMDTFIRQYNSVDVSVAVSTESGLITPIVFNADTKGVMEINADVIRLADAARKGKLKPHEFQGGTFTVSNLGMFGIKNFAAVINPPQSCILAVGGAVKQLVVDEKSEQGFRVGQTMNVTLSCDHRVVDGAVGAEWLKHFKRFLEQPETMLL